MDEKDNKAPVADPSSLPASEVTSSTEQSSITELSPSTSVSTVPKRGGSRKGAGRPKKGLDITTDPYDSTKTLKALNFDPIVEAVAILKELDQKIKWMKRQARPSMPAIAQLLNTKRAVNNDLLRFGYRPVPEKTVSELQFVPIDITLTDQPMSEIGIERLSIGDLDLKKDLEIKH